MGEQLRVASLNLQGAFQRSRWRGDLPRLIADHRPDIALLQECRGGWLKDICDVAEMEGAFYYDVPPKPRVRARDGCAIAVRVPLRIEDVWRIPPDDFQPGVVETRIAEQPIPGYEELPGDLADLYSARALFARLTLQGRTFVVASFHATPGTGRSSVGKVHEHKPFFHGAAALALSDLDEPFVFGIDANEPVGETPTSVNFGWREGRPGHQKLASLLSLEPIHPGRDLLREWLEISGEEPESDACLRMTHELKSGPRRYDSIWATRDLGLKQFWTHYEEALAAGTDHALLVADLRLQSQSRR